MKEKIENINNKFLRVHPLDDLLLKRNTQNGITLLALTITIIILLILAVVTIKLVIDGGILTHANTSKEEQITAQEKEFVSLAYSEYKMSKTNNPNYAMQEALDAEKAEATAEGDELYGWVITFEKTNHQYMLFSDGTINETIPDKWDGIAKQTPQITEDKNWHIYNSAQMKYFADFVNGNLTEEEKGDLSITQDTIVYLEADLDLGARANEKGEKTAGTQWTPVGATASKAFIGTFEGNNHYITGVYVNINGNFGGVFGNSNTIKNLTVCNSYIHGSNCCGGIVGAVRNGTIEKCHNINTIVKVDAKAVGGVAGQLTSKTGAKVINCSNTGNVTGNNQVGGIVGTVGTTASVVKCNNSGNVTGKITYIGGIAGYSNLNSIISECNNSANVSSVTDEISSESNMVGGIVGSCHGKIQKSTNSGKILVKSGYKWNRAGGIAGWLGISQSNECKIEQCSNYGDITSEGIKTYMALAGGIVGDSSSNYSILNCYNAGNIKGKSASYVYIGGIAGRQGKPLNDNIVIQYCYSKGAVESEEVLKLLRCGGIAGDVYNAGNIKTSYYYDVLGNNIGALEGKDYVENDVGKTENNFNHFDEFYNWVINK